eukprot:4290994-Pleurochrysis_carterae.AAC.1
MHPHEAETRLHAESYKCARGMQGHACARTCTDIRTRTGSVHVRAYRSARPSTQARTCARKHTRPSGHAEPPAHDLSLSHAAAPFPSSPRLQPEPPPLPPYPNPPRHPSHPRTLPPPLCTLPHARFTCLRHVASIRSRSCRS